MEKINFEDATLKKSAYVTIGGTEYPVTDAEYVGGVDLDAATLNYAFQLMHPVGSVYISTSSANPANIFGFGTWEPCCVGRFPLGVDENDPNIGLSGYKDGEKEVTLTKNDLPKTIGQALLYDSNAAEQPSETDALVTQWSKKYRTGLENVVNQFGGSAHNNMPPYETFYFWKRTE